MSAVTVLLQQPAADTTGAGVAGAAPLGRADIAARLSSSIEDVEAIWRGLERPGLESPGQSYDFIRLWVRERAVPAQDQAYVVGSVAGVPVALLALHRRCSRGVRLFSWFPGANVGCYAPLADLDRLEALGPAGRRALWDAMIAQLQGADLVYLRMIPELVGGKAGLFAELGTPLSVETLYRAEFSSWAHCDSQQRTKSRRKHDRQQGERLEAMGTVDFAEIRNGGDTAGVIDTMFVQRAARFKAMGIRDPFARQRLTGFYRAAAASGSGIDVRLHVLRLNGAIVAVRYNIVEGQRMFCLISSMSDDPAIQNGSPGKQCLLRVMQTVFEQGLVMFDMGAGFTDEKRHWCNVHTPLRHHYLPLSPWGRAVLSAHQALQKTRARIKANKRLMSAIRAPGQWLNRHKTPAA